MDHTASVDAYIGNLRDGDHLCALYENQSTLMKTISSFVGAGFRDNRQIVYIADRKHFNAIATFLSYDGLPVDRLLETKQLLLMPPEDTCLQKSFFQPDGMIDFLLRETMENSRKGFQGLSISVDMSWVLKGTAGTERFIEYEYRINNCAKGNRIIWACQYDINRFKPDLIQKALEVHSLAIIGEQLIRSPFYIPPDNYLSDWQDEVRLRTLLNGLLDYQYTCSSLLDMQNQLELVVKNRTKTLNSTIRILQKESELRRESVVAMRYSEGKLTALINAISESAFLIDRNTNVLEINETGAERLGYSREELMGKPFDFFLPPAVAKTRKKMVQKVISSKQPVSFSDQRESFFFETTIWPILNRSKEVDRLAIFARDITEQKKLVRDLRLKNSAIDSANSGIAISDQNFIITYVNHAFVHLCGVENKEEVLGLNGFDLWPDKKEVRDAITLIKEYGYWFGELESRNKNGEKITVLVSASQIYDEEYDQKAYMASFVDVSARKLLNELILKKSRQQEDYNTAMKVLIEHRNLEKERLAENVLTGVNTIIQPFLKQIREDGLNARQMALMDVLDTNLKELTGPLTVYLSSRYPGITPRENKIAVMVREGKTSDEIADIFNVSRNTVIFHRQNLRRKLGLHGKKKSLAVHLRELMEPGPEKNF